MTAISSPPIKLGTLLALTNMPQENAERAARKIIQHFDGIEFGIERLELPDGSEVTYVNTGDTYSATLLFVGGEWIYSCWGSVVEAAEIEYAADTGESLCGYCGQWSEGECHPE